MKRIMKMMFTFLLIFVSVITVGKVKAEETLNSDFKISIEDTRIVQDYNAEAEKGTGGSYIFLTVNSNNEHFNKITGFGVARYGNYYYSVNGSDYIKLTDTDSFNGFSIKIYYDDFKDALDKNNELEIKVYFETTDKTIKTEVTTKTVLVVEEDVTLKDEKKGVIIENNYDLPYGSEISVEEVTDEKILNAMKLTNPTAWKIKVTAYGKDLKYYDDKYGYNNETSSGMLFAAYVTLPVPSKYNRDYGLDILGQLISSDLKLKETAVDHVMNDDLSKYKYQVREAKYLSDYYFVLSDKIEFNDESSIWEEFVENVKKNEFIKSYKSTIEHDDEKMIITTPNDNGTYITQFNYDDGIVSYKKDETKSNSALMIDGLIQAAVIQEWLKEFNLNIEDSGLEKFLASNKLTLDKDGIEYIEKEVKLNEENSEVTFTYFTDLKFDLISGLKTYKKVTVESTKEEIKTEIKTETKVEENKPEEKEETVKNPNTGIAIGMTSLSTLLIVGLVMKKKNKFNKV